MHTVTVEITNNNALKILQDLQDKQYIKIIDNPDFNSLVFPGAALSEQEFKELIFNRQDGPKVSLTEAKAKWAKKKKQLLKSAK